MSKQPLIDRISLGEPWAITREGYDTVLAVAQRQTEDLAALATKLGRPLDNTRTVTMRGSVAVIPLSGPIFPKANLMTDLSGATSLECFIQDVVSAAENPGVSAIVLDIHSPGGQITGILEAATVIRQVGKPCVAYVGGMAASAAYPLAAAANEIVADPMAMLGNLGVVMSIRPKAADAPLEIVSSQSPDKRPDAQTDSGRAVLQALVDELGAVLIQAAADLRGKTLDHMASLGGRMLVGQKAVDFGLADKTGTLDSVVAFLSNPSMRVNRMSANAKLDAASLKAEHPEVYATVLAEGKAAGLEDGKREGQALGAAAERERIKGIEALAIPGHEALLEKLKFEGSTSVPEAALQLIQAEKSATASHLADWRKDAAPPVPSAKLSGTKAVTPEGNDPPKQDEGNWAHAFAKTSGLKL